jgi:hypothetical protein
MLRLTHFSPSKRIGLGCRRALQALTDQKNDQQAWDALFRHFDQTHGFGNAGDTPGEKIAIKINGNQDRGAVWPVPRAFPQRPAGAAGGPGGTPPSGAPAGGSGGVADRADAPGGGAPGGGLAGSRFSPDSVQNGLPSPPIALAWSHS